MFEYYLDNKQYVSNTFDFLLQDKLHREDGPALIYKNDDLKYYTIEYWIKGELHSLDKAARTHYNDDDSISSEHWFKNNSLHREDGPAVIFYNKRENDMANKCYYLNGVQFIEKQYYFISKNNKANVFEEDWLLDFKMVFKLL